MGTNKIHPSVRRAQQNRKKLLRSYRPLRGLPHHSRKWWKSWDKTWNATHRKVDGTEEGEQK